jgi:hypothetical protein
MLTVRNKYNDVKLATVFSTASSSIKATALNVRDGIFLEVDVRQDVQDRDNEDIQGRMKYRVWTTGRESWSLSSDGSNQPLYPGFAAEYVSRALHFQERDCDCGIAR